MAGRIAKVSCAGRGELSTAICKRRARLGLPGAQVGVQAGVPGFRPTFSGRRARRRSIAGVGAGQPNRRPQRRQKAAKGGWLVPQAPQARRPDVIRWWWARYARAFDALTIAITTTMIRMVSQQDISILT